MRAAAAVSEFTSTGTAQIVSGLELPVRRRSQLSIKNRTQRCSLSSLHLLCYVAPEMIRLPRCHAFPTSDLFESNVGARRAAATNLYLPQKYSSIA